MKDFYILEVSTYILKRLLYLAAFLLTVLLAHTINKKIVQYQQSANELDSLKIENLKLDIEIKKLKYGKTIN